MDAKTATIVSAIEYATRHMRNRENRQEAPPTNPQKPWKPHCSAMFRETMRQLSIHGVRIPAVFSDESANANLLGMRIRESSDWIEVPAEQAQYYANHGAIVVGTYINPNRDQPGHIGFVYPVEVKGRNEPLIRDGNIHRTKSTGAIIAASSYGASPANKAFVLGKTRWFRYRHY